MANIFNPSVSNMTGDSGSGGQAGLVPAPPAGAAAAGDFLSASGNWSVPTAAAAFNMFINSGFDYWQAAGTSISMASGASNYLADQWYAANGMGVSSLLVYSQLTASLAGSGFGAQLKVGAAPNAAGSTGINLVQVLENPQTIRVYNQTISAAAQVKALGNIVAVGLQVIYAQTEIKPTLSTTIGSATVTGVTTTGFINCQLNGIALGTSMTTAGVVGIKIYGASVSSGNVSDANNGFIVEQAMFNTGSNAGSWARAYATASGELASCQRFFAKSFPLTTAPAQAAGVGGAMKTRMQGSNNFSCNVSLSVLMRSTPTLTTYNTTSSNTSARDTDNAADVAFVDTIATPWMLEFAFGSGLLGIYRWHYTADARI